MRTIEELLQQATLLQAEAEEYALCIEGMARTASNWQAFKALSVAGKELAAACYWMERDEEDASDSEVSE